MTDEFPDTFGYRFGERGEQGVIQRAGGSDAERTIRRDHADDGDRLPEFLCQRPEHGCLQSSLPQIRTRQGSEANQFEGIPDRRHAAFICRSQQWPDHLRKDVGMFVCVQVRNMNAARLNFGDLRGGFCFDLVGIQPPEKCAPGELTNAGREVRVVIE